MEIIKNKKGNIFYREKIYVEGREIKSPRFSKKKDAKEWKSIMIIERLKSSSHLATFSKMGNILFKDFATNYLEGQIKMSLSFRTYQGHEGRIRRHMLPFFGNVEMKKINMNHLNNLILRLKENGHKNSGINHITGTLKKIMNQALLEGVVLKNPFLGSKKLREDFFETIFFTSEEIRKILLANKNDEMINFIIAALNTGMRRGELAGLCWDKIDLTRKTIEVSRTRDQFSLRDTTKTGEKRYLPMNDTIFDLLTSLKKSKSSQYVFVRKNGAPIDVHHVYRYFNLMQEKAKIVRRGRFHDLRHTFASHFMMNGGNIYDLQKILGHSKSEMTHRYAHLSKNHLAKVINIVNFK